MSSYAQKRYRAERRTFQTSLQVLTREEAAPGETGLRPRNLRWVLHNRCGFHKVTDDRVQRKRVRRLPNQPRTSPGSLEVRLIAIGPQNKLTDHEVTQIHTNNFFFFGLENYM